MLWDSGCTHSINPYFEIYTEYKNLEKGKIQKSIELGVSSIPTAYAP